MPEHLSQLVAETANFALARSTWSTYSSSLNMLRKCNQELHTNLKVPMKEADSLTFIGWMLDRGLSAATISSYLAGIRQNQIALGLGGESLRTPLINQVISGRRNQENLKKIMGEARERIPVTPKMLLLMKKDLKLSNMDKAEKLLIWSICTLMFFGAFRGGELLAKKERSFDPLTVLRGKDITLKNLVINKQKIQVLQVKLKCEKTARSGDATIVDVYAANNETCPVAAWKKWRSMNFFDPHLPAFMLNQSTAFTCNRFNQYLANFNRKYLNEPGRTLSAHCFRAGMATLLARIGFTDAEIMATGRWSSKAFMDYIKMPRSNRLAMARKISQLSKEQ